MKAAIVVDEDPFAKSLSGEFKQIFEKDRRKGKVVKTCDFSQVNFRLEKCMDPAEIAEINVLLLALSNKTFKDKEKNVLANIFSNNLINTKIQILGGDTLYDQVIKSVYIDKIMVEAFKSMKDSPNRKELHDGLSKGFSRRGATGTVEFNSDNDRKPSTGIGVLVKVENSTPEPDFVILKRPERNNP